MTFELSYELDYRRVILAVINDARNSIPATKDKDGSAIYAYAQSQIALVIPGVLVYRVVGDDGVLCGFCALQIKNSVANLYFMQLRSAFQQFSDPISQIISNFIINGSYRNDYLS